MRDGAREVMSSLRCFPARSAPAIRSSQSDPLRDVLAPNAVNRPIVPTELAPLRPVLTAEAMREADRRTIEDYGIPSLVLMETASRATADAVVRRYGPADELTLTFLCGKGNNGGDGLVAARVLYDWGARVRVVTMSGPDGMSEDAVHNYRLLDHLAGEDQHGRLALYEFDSLGQIAAFDTPDVYVDALLGTGLNSAPRSPMDEVVAWLNEQPQPVVAVDMPTGLHSDTGEVLGGAVRANLTVTMAALKAGLLLGEGPGVAGRVVVADIGIPGFVMREVMRQDGCARQPTEDAVRGWLPERAFDAHKYSAGLALVVAGSPGLTGAPVMASQAAARIGAGAVVCACQEEVQPVLAQKMTEVMTLALPEGDRGGLDPHGAWEALQDRLEKAQALLVGPGLGRAEGTQTFVRDLLRRVGTSEGPPVVIDADGLNALAEHTDLMTRHAGGRWIVTPHAGEFGRLAGEEADLTDRVRTAQNYARRWDVVLVLKGMPSLVATPAGAVFVNPTGGTALASAGTGDILAGLCAGLLAQGLAPERAAVAALYLGGAAADRYAAHRHPHTLQATDLLGELPYLLHEYFQ